MGFGREFTKGLWKENPLFVIILGTCPTLATTTKMENGMSMALAATGVLLCCNIIIALIKGVVPREVRIPCYIVVIATFVTMCDNLMKAFVPDLNAALGIFIPLIVVNCIILGRAEAFASRNSVYLSIADALGMGLGYFWALALVATIREVIGSGSFFGTPFIEWDKCVDVIQPVSVLQQAPGAFIVLGILFAFFQYLRLKKKDKEYAATLAGGAA
jgi:electron transport complex protein RnfE